MIPVVVGLIFNAKGEILVAQRADNKFQGGRWEFPGGKVEPHENSYQALQRELFEEIGIQVTAAEPSQQYEHIYPERTILLDVWRVTDYVGEPYGKEGQAIKWVSLATLITLEIPDANWDIIRSL